MSKVIFEIGAAKHAWPKKCERQTDEIKSSDPGGDEVYRILKKLRFSQFLAKIGKNTRLRTIENRL